MDIATEAILYQGKISRALTDREIDRLGAFALELLREFDRLTDESIDSATNFASSSGRALAH
jgi:hypothetical protein